MDTSLRRAIQQIQRERHVQGIGHVGFETKLGVLVDEMDIMYTDAHIALLEEKIAIHKRHSKEEREKLGWMTVKQRGVSFERNWNPEWHWT